MDISNIIFFSLDNHSVHLPKPFPFLYSLLLSYVIVGVWFSLVVKAIIVVFSPLWGIKTSFNLIAKRENKYKIYETQMTGIKLCICNWNEIEWNEGRWVCLKN